MSNWHLVAVSNRLFQKLAAEYEAEQNTIEAKIAAMTDELENLRQSKQDTTAWLALIKDYAEIQELDRIILSELVDKITVGETRIVDGEKQVDVTIYYRFIGAI